MTMTAFRRFDPYAILARADREQQTLAALAGATAEIVNEPDGSEISDSNRANDSRNHRGTPAKGANEAAGALET
jgi:hypothetical protein